MDETFCVQARRIMINLWYRNICLQLTISSIKSRGTRGYNGQELQHDETSNFTLLARIKDNLKR